MACNVYIASCTFVVAAWFSESKYMRVSVRGLPLSCRGYMLSPHTSTGVSTPAWAPGRECVPGGVCRELGALLWFGGRGTGELAEGHRRNYSQEPNTAVEISHDLPNSTFYIL